LIRIQPIGLRVKSTPTKRTAVHHYPSNTLSNRASTSSPTPFSIHQDSYPRVPVSSKIVGYYSRPLGENKDNFDVLNAAASRPSFTTVDWTAAKDAEERGRKRRLAAQLVRNARNKRQYGGQPPAPPTGAGPVYTFMRTDTAGNYKWGVRHSVP
jgi:hypothetical protein